MTGQDASGILPGAQHPGGCSVNGCFCFLFCFLFRFVFIILFKEYSEELPPGHLLVSTVVR